MRQHANVWSKVSCPDGVGSGPPARTASKIPTDVIPFAALVETFPDRVLWGTDWRIPM